MENKCDKYESYFLFGNTEGLEKHIESCADCRDEAENQKKLSYLLNFAGKECKKLQQNRHQRHLAKAACFVLLIITIGSYTGYNSYITNKLNQNYNYSIFSSDDFNSAILSQKGYPTDSFGFIEYD